MRSQQYCIHNGHTDGWCWFWNIILSGKAFLWLANSPKQSVQFFVGLLARFRHNMLRPRPSASDWVTWQIFGTPDDSMLPNWCNGSGRFLHHGKFSSRPEWNWRKYGNTVYSIQMYTVYRCITNNLWLITYKFITYVPACFLFQEFLWRSNVQLEGAVSLISFQVLTD